MLGLNPRGSVLAIDPCIPRAWHGFEVTYRHRTATYHITVENPRGVCRGIARIALDERDLAKTTDGIPLVDDGAEHEVRVTLG
jgi:cyclic beta-1,2-glucan synthetase